MLVYRLLIEIAVRTSSYHLTDADSMSTIFPGNARLGIKLNCVGRASQLIYILQNERHSYEKCQYEEFKKRVAKMDEIRAAKGGARSN
jgi:NADH-ubiquinone oxidoreductase B18 subunit (NDUFB7)